MARIITIHGKEVRVTVSYGDMESFPRITDLKDRITAGIEKAAATVTESDGVALLDAIVMPMGSCGDLEFEYDLCGKGGLGHRIRRGRFLIWESPNRTPRSYPISLNGNLP